MPKPCGGSSPSAPEPSSSSSSSVLDFAIIGAGISGINFAYRIQSTLPLASYAILEGRDSIGGTWDLFRYPGVRSDSDLYTLGFVWRPWLEGCAIAEGDTILKYMRQAVREKGIDRHVRMGHKVLKARWTDKSQQWTLDVESNGELKHIHSRFLIFGTGYYDYKNPLCPPIPDLEQFTGEVVHPQFWPEDLNYAGKHVVVIGSGATAVTLLPNLAQKAGHVTMLQRSPSYIISADNKTELRLLRRFIPLLWIYQLLRWRQMAIMFLLVQFCDLFPNFAKRQLRTATEKVLPAHVPYDPHFKPRYKPWEQRLCVSPNGDFFDALRSRKASVSTGHIQGIKDRAIILESGEQIEDVDVIITATGLRMMFAGDIEVSVNGKTVNLAEKFLWKGCMFQDMPNACLVVGYTNASWTLGADATAILFCRLVQQMQRLGSASARPHLDAKQQSVMKSVPVIDLSSTYVQKARDSIPKAGDRGVWKPKYNFLSNYWDARWGDIMTGLRFSPKANS
ncbi:hypothetical protein AJ80_05946 [Polytolypa hystricis UAMH7299]|uniref:FAD/NAD(P)-binding domain-containing protein n=1 Tax=Polytolypa hystricis (strain UAMH7299) TaxID=1447883 RepID=A0A2B7XYS4_POLH7|nr:hypothetical protein AJ80_05946 [Polytolypa hystricis UAMH7299]